MNSDALKPTTAKSRGGRSRPANTSAPAGDVPVDGATSKLTQLVALLSRAEGARLAEMTAATGWQAHSVRGALAGVLKRKGHVVLSDKVDGVRRYRIGAAQ